MHFIQLSMKKEHFICACKKHFKRPAMVCYNTEPSYSWIRHTQKKIKIKKASLELLQLCATVLCKMSLFLRLLIKISSTESKYSNGGLRHL